MSHEQATVAGMPRRICRRNLVLALLLVPLALGTASDSKRIPCNLAPELRRVRVQRMDLTVTLRVGGVVESARRTVIRCPLESLSGKRFATSIIWLAPEGSLVQEGDELCRLDASEHEELERLERIALAVATADKRRAELDLDVASSGLREYREGRCHLETREFEARIAQARAQLTQTTDRLEWSRRMLKKGYVSTALVSASATARERSEFELTQLECILRSYRAFERPITFRVLEGRVKAAQSNLMYQSVRVKEIQARLTQLEHQVASCRIRAPHDGLLLYAHNTKRDVRIEEGTWVRQNQELLHLPDLSRLEVQALLHETVIERVRPGMRALVRTQGAAGVVEGQVSAIDPLPLVAGNWRSAGDVKSFVAHIPLESHSQALRPGLTAEVEIATARLPDALVVPAEAARRENGRDVCYVATPGGLERRAVTLGQCTETWAEVQAGLSEGEEVVLCSTSAPALPADTGALGSDGSFSKDRGL
jgi:HlyD family secretion protein